MSTPDPGRQMVSVVIPAYNAQSRLAKILPLFSSQDYPHEKFEVIVVNDGSPDKTKEVSENFAADFTLRVLSYEKNRGRAFACNTGIRNARGEIIIIIDDDMSFDIEFIARHEKYHHGNVRIAVIGMVQDAAMEIKTAFVKTFISQRAASIKRCIKQSDGFEFSRCATGNFSMRKALFHEVGLFDEDFKTYGFEDWELGYRLVTAGVKLVYAPDASARHHFYMDTLSKLCGRKYLEGHSAAVFCRKHPDAGDLFEVDTAYIFKGRLPALVKKIIKGLLINRMTLPILHLLVFLNETIFRRGTPFLYDQIGAYYYRRGLRERLKQ